ncbi:hypothetical protein L7F22_065320 [Adiantum nelumboides]|nr:hypothetical protein [Adiantum nelumboides]
MGGEWMFTFDSKYAEERPLDVAAYQNKLRHIKAKYAGSVAVRPAQAGGRAPLMRRPHGAPVGVRFGEKEGGPQLQGEGRKGAEEEEEEDAEVWFGENPDHNVFAQFTYKCTRHGHWGPSGHKPCWFLLWDPTPSPHRYTPSNDIHARCAGFHFKKQSAAIQEELQRAFPRYFQLDWGDGISGFN